MDQNPHTSNEQVDSNPTQLGRRTVDWRDAEAAEWLQDAGNAEIEAFAKGAMMFSQRVIEATSLPEGQDPTTPLHVLVDPEVNILPQEGGSSVSRSSEMVSEEAGRRLKVGDMTGVVTDRWDIG